MSNIKDVCCKRDPGHIGIHGGVDVRTDVRTYSPGAYVMKKSPVGIL